MAPAIALARDGFLLGPADAAIIASRMDGTILVSRSGFIPRHLCMQAKSSIESVNGRVIGCVLNYVRSEHQPYYYHQYTRQYGRYRDEKEEDSESNGELPSEPTSTIDRVKILKEPFFTFLSTMWTRLEGFLKWEQTKKEEESKTPVGTP